MAKHYLARTVTENPSYMQAALKVQAGTTEVAGNIFVAEKLDNAVKGAEGDRNLMVYTPEAITDITKQDIVLVLNNGFETLTDGRRPEGQPDYTQYGYGAGEVVTAHRLIPGVRFEISVDACDESVANAGTLAVGDNLIPANGKNVLVYSKAGTAVTAKNYLTIEAIRDFRLGGQSGMEHTKTLIVRAKSN